tara:strand:+ start:4255 stop:7179 length:2925 start_codon:yes stop_codon:yes gene_type:complete
VLRSLFILFVFSSFSSSIYSQYTFEKEDSLLNLGNQFYQKGDYGRSKNIYLEVLSNDSYAKGSKQWIISSVSLGISLIDLGEIRLGTQWIQKADYALSEKISYELQAFVKSNVAWASWWNGDLNLAYSQYQVALELAVKSRNDYRIAQINNSISLASHELGFYDQAINQSKKSVRIFESLNEPFLLSMSLSNLFIYYNDLGFTQKAETALLKSLEIKKEINNSDLLARDYERLGLFYTQFGDFNKSLFYLNKFLTISSSLKNVDKKLSALLSIGDIYFSLGEYEKSLNYYNSNLQLLEKERKAQNKAKTLLKIAPTYQKLGQLDLARTLFNEALIIFKKDDNTHQIIDTYLKLVDLELISGNQTDALVTAKKAQEMSVSTESKQLKARSYAALGKVHLTLNNPEQALQFARKAYEIASLFKGYRVADYLILLSETHYKTGSDRSFYYADLAFSEIEREQSNIYGDNLESGVFKKYAGFYDKVAYWYLEKENNTRKAFEITERGKSRVLLNRLAFSESGFLKQLDEATLLTIRQKEKNIDKLYREIENASNPDFIDNLKEDLRKAEFDYQSYTNKLKLKNEPLETNQNLPIISIPDLQNKLSKTSAVIEYFTFDKNLISLWITKNKVEYSITQLSSNQSAAAFLVLQIARFRDSIQQNVSVDEIKELGNELYDQLLGSFPEEYPNVTEVLIIPTYSISTLPFEALYSEDEYLIEKMNVKYLPSASIYDFIKAPHRETAKKILAVAGSGFNAKTESDALRSQGNFASLPSTILEVEAISAVFDENTILKNEQVTEAVIKSLPLSEYKYLHFATHGSINTKNPLQSGLIISKLNDFERTFGEDGFLNSQEISNLALNADLVVISSCESGVGKVVEGEGVLGLQRSFLQAGASSVIVSLWSVFDKSTAVFMKDFYEKLTEYEEKEIGIWSKTLIFLDMYEPPLFGYKEKALRDAKLAMLDHPYYNHPVHWAPFIMIGK